MLIAMVTWDTEENGRSKFTELTMRSLVETVDWAQHRIIVSDNGSCPETSLLLRFYKKHLSAYGEGTMQIIWNGSNIGTANAINNAWRLRKPGENCVKMDNDVVIKQAHWADWIEDVFRRDPTIGICGLKRKDCDERPWHRDEHYRSSIRMLPQIKGERWLIVEEVVHVMGTCQAYSSALLDKIGYLYQPSVYGFDDSLASIRAAKAGFKRVFLHGVEIDHIDPGGTWYQTWKESEAGLWMAEFNAMKAAVQSGRDPVYYGGDF